MDNRERINQIIETIQNASLEAEITNELVAEVLALIDQNANGKVDKVTGKGLSSNDFTNALKSKVENLELTYVKQTTGKGLSSNDFTDAYKQMLERHDENIDNIVEYDSNTREIAEAAKKRADDAGTIAAANTREIFTNIKPQLDALTASGALPGVAHFDRVIDVANGVYPGPDELGIFQEFGTTGALALFVDSSEENNIPYVRVCVEERWVTLDDVDEQQDVFDNDSRLAWSSNGYYRLNPAMIFVVEYGNIHNAQGYRPVGYYVPNVDGENDDTLHKIITSDEFSDVVSKLEFDMSKIPTAQEGKSGTTGNYIYSTQSSNKTGDAAKTAVVVLKNTGFFTVNGALQLRLGVWGQGTNDYFSEAVPIANASHPGIITKETASKIAALPTAAELSSEMEGKVDKVTGKGLSTHDFNSEWLTRVSNAGVYSRFQSNLNKSFSASNNVFALSKASTSDDIRRALTDYESGNVLTDEDLAYCATNGCMIYNAATQGFVQVTCNGGGFYNLMELSFLNFQQLPKLRWVCLRWDGSAWSVSRNGQEERLCTFSEYQLLAARVTALEGA